MALNQLQEEMEIAAVKDRMDHVIGVWKDMTLVWGGRGSKMKFWDPEIVHCYLDGIWMKKRTRGEVPPPIAGPGAGIIGDQLFVACGYTGIGKLAEDLFSQVSITAVTDTLYKLDLNQWIWSKLEPGGTKPLKSFRMASWVSEERLFLFGGIGKDKIGGYTYPESLKTHRDIAFVRSNQLVYYDSATNYWYWPPTHGKIPPPRMGFAACLTDDPNSKSNLSGSYVIVFGGRGHQRRYNNIVLLNLANMTWINVSSNGLARSEDAGVWPEPRWLHTLTKVSEKTAVLYGGSGRGTLGDCWMLNIEAVISQANPENIWTRCFHHEGHKRQSHRAVMEPSCGRLWIVGGMDWPSSIVKCAVLIRELSITSKQKLKVLAIEQVSRDPEKYGEAITTLPQDLQRAITTKAKNHIVT